MSKSERIRRSSLLQRYGLDLHDYYAMYVRQSGLCLGCHKRPDHTMHVDHDHATGEVRGLLCARCNSALSVVENHTLVRNLTEYLQGKAVTLP